MKSKEGKKVLLSFDFKRKLLIFVSKWCAHNSTFLYVNVYRRNPA